MQITQITAVPSFKKSMYRPFGYERVYLLLYKVADTLFYIQGDDITSYQN